MDARVTTDPAVAEPAGSGSPLEERSWIGSYDDMTDAPADLDAAGALAEYLSFCQGAIRGLYERSDRAALHHQRLHRAITISAVVFGTLAVFFAVVQLSGFIEDS